MYGGHITDDWDRKLCKTYLEEYMHPDMVSLSSDIHPRTITSRKSQIVDDRIISSSCLAEILAHFSILYRGHIGMSVDVLFSFHRVISRCGVLLGVPIIIVSECDMFVVTSNSKQMSIIQFIGTTR